MPAGKIQKRVLADICDEDHVAPVAAVAAVGAALGYVGLASKRDAPRPAVAGLSV